MTKAGAIHSFWSSFGLNAYEENAVPTGDDAPEFPYITYELMMDDLGNDTAMTASVWYRSTSWVEANAKAEEIGRRIRFGGILRHCDGGRIWIMRGVPFAQSMGDESDDRIRRKIINIT
ncbi:MAG: hypothetical protein IJ334_16420, partial [Clostridia bacterium]|nr:hypothetical protein [Clostridia bacterium]